MKGDFHGFYRPTDDEFDEIWSEGIIVFDANVLLNLYTYSESTSNEILALIGGLDDRIWGNHKRGHCTYSEKYNVPFCDFQWGSCEETQNVLCPEQ
jgi:hypothetical protein